MTDTELENRRLREIVVELHWMARRYCDGRMSYVSGMFNRLTRELLGMGVPLNATDDKTVFATDGMGRAYDRLSDAEATPGTLDAMGGSNENRR